MESQPEKHGVDSTTLGILRIIMSKLHSNENSIEDAQYESSMDMNENDVLGESKS